MPSIVPAKPRPLLDIPFGPMAYVPLDLQGQTAESYPGHVQQVRAATGARVAYGGYLEPRKIYQPYQHFENTGAPVRNIHLGVDFWAPAGTHVLCPLDGAVHSWANRDFPGDYGGVILLEHDKQGAPLFSLYGHLSAASLQGLRPGLRFKAGQRLGQLGTFAENGGWYPHLHFQLIRDPQHWQGDYPGVCAAEDLAFYRNNCPDPLPFLNYT